MQSAIAKTLSVTENLDFAPASRGPIEARQFFKVQTRPEKPSPIDNSLFGGGGHNPAYL